MATDERAQRHKILVADDSEINRAILIEILEGQYDIIEACDGEEAVNILQNENDDISLVFLDINMPVLNGFQVLEAMNRNKWIDDTPVIIISAENTSDFAERAYNLGVTDYITTPFDAFVVRRRVQNTLMLYEKQKRLISLVGEQVHENQKNNSIMISILSHIVEFGNEESGPHIQHIKIITELLLKALSESCPQYAFSHEKIALIATASALHDIGKVSIPSEILNKPGRLTDEEYAVMKTHSAIGASMLEKLPIYKDEPLVKTAYEICRWHHERYDGRGYPDGLKGDDIPIAAQVVALADVYDALTSERVYKKAYPHDKAVEMIKNGECGAFNPVLLKVLDKVSDELYDELHAEDNDDEEDERNITAEILQSKQIPLIGRTAALLEKERKKFLFVSSVSSGIIFEFTYSPNLLKFLNGGYKRMGVAEKVSKPVTDKRLLDCCGKRVLVEVTRLLKNATPENPEFEYEGEITLDGVHRKCKLIARTMWSGDELPQLTGAVGKVIPSEG